MEIDLTPEQQDILNSLADPDAPTESKYSFDKSIQQDILALMIHERIFMIQGMHLIKHNYFVDKAHVLLCKILCEWFDKHAAKSVFSGDQWIKKEYIFNEVEQRVKDKSARSYYLAETQTIYESYVQGLSSRDYLLSLIADFAWQQEMRLAIGKVVDLIKTHDDEKREKVEFILKTAMLVGPRTDLGLNYFESVDERYERMKKDREGKERFKSGWDEIDTAIVGGGLSRGELGAWEAMSGAGKSWMLMKGAVENVKSDKRVLFISLEMDEDKVAERFDCLYSGVPMKNLLVNEAFVKHTLKAHLKQISLEEKLDLHNVAKTDDMDKRRLIIKQFPAGTADMGTIRAYYSQVCLQGFKPDILIVDYVGEFKDVPGIKTYESRQRVVRDLRAFGVEENHCTLTAMQSNRSGRFAQDGGFIDDSEIGDSYGQARVMDAIWSINQTKKEKIDGLGRIFVVKNRNGKSRYHFCFRQDPAKLALQAPTEGAYKDRISAIKEQTEEEEVAEQFEGDKFNPNDKNTPPEEQFNA